MIRETCAQIGELAGQHERERQRRYARRNRIHLIDEMLNEFEMLNLADEPRIPGELQAKVRRLVVEERHPLAERPASDVRILDWMDALYDVQDTLMLNDAEDPE
ncbi:MAG TPA: hypothetical protein VFO60_09790 [Candidatus Dormibacteraeota bacterium]|nr:hypothetical protein [Candidatus Dormibacteraeota bacterium]